MSSFHDDYEKFDELSFEDVAASRRTTKERHRHSAKSGGRKHKRHASHNRRDALDWDDIDDSDDSDDFDDFDDFEFDAQYRATVDH